MHREKNSVLKLCFWHEFGSVKDTFKISFKYESTLNVEIKFEFTFI